MLTPRITLVRRAFATALLWLVAITGVAVIDSARDRRLPALETAAYTAVSVMLLAAAAASAVLIVVDNRRDDRARAARRHNRPIEPWLWWREDWAAGFAYDESILTAGRDWLMANLAMSVSTVLVIAAGPAWHEQPNAAPRPFLVALAAAGVGGTAWLTWRAARGTRRILREPSAVCRFAQIPIRPGEEFQARIELPAGTLPPDGVSVTMQCAHVFLQSTTSRQHPGSRRYARGLPGRPASRIRPALHVEQTIVRDAVPIAGGIQVPVSMRIPPRVEVRRALFDPGGTLEWSLEVQAKGVPSARFTLPVFPDDLP